MAQFPANIDLSSLDGNTGFKLTGSNFTFFGRSVASAGDVNGDGFADVIVGSSASASYVVFGQASGFAASIGLASLDGSTGFSLSGAGFSVNSAGDVNGDGVADLIVGDSGVSYVVFGQASGFAANIALGSLNGSTGFRLSGAGTAVASAGDVNGDGFADLIVGSTGAQYVVFGKASGFAANIDLSALDGITGFTLSGAGGIQGAGGRFVGSAGDVNGDGFADLIVGADLADVNGTDSGASYVVFGKASGFAANVDLSALDGTSGFRLSGAAGHRSGFSVASAGDVNGDGLADVIVGAVSANVSYVVFGQASGFAANIDLSSLDGTTGFRIAGAGTSANSAGDVNGDGFADLIVGDNYASPHGANSGASYVVFGQASGFAANIDVANLDGTTGFKLSGEAANDRSGRFVGSAGDVNGDGFADLIVGAPFASPNASYVVFANLPDTAVNRTGTDAGQTLAGGDFDDTLSALGGDDVLHGNGGDDTLAGGARGDTLIGGGGSDTASYAGSGAGVTVNLGAGTASGGDAAGDTLSEIENLIGSAQVDTLTGDGGDNVLEGGGGADTLDGGAGDDTLIGGLGNDSYRVDSANDVVTETTGGGYDIVVATADYTLPADVEALYMNGSGLTGTGSAGADTLLSIGGANTLVGLGGNDLYYVNNAGDAVTESANADFDTVVTTVSYAMPANVEALYLVGTGLTGTGSGGTDTLLSFGGANTLVGLGGDDLYYVNSVGDTVTETAGGGYDTVVATADYTLPANVEALYLVGTGLTGTGSGGTDTLLSFGGANTLVGLGGDDLYYVNDTADTVTETAGGGYDTVVATVDYTMPADVEALYMNGAGLTGTGSGGADTLLSIGGANTLIGLGGNDFYYVNNAGDAVTESANADFDTVVTTVSYAMPANVEALYLVGTGLTGTGSGGTDALLSFGGANTLVGLGGDDLYYVNNTADTVTETAGGGYDTVVATVDYTMPADVEALYMNGSGLTGSGSGGTDTLLSIGGANTLVGLDGDDLYYVNNAGDTVTEMAGGGYDTVMATVDYTIPRNVEALYVNGSGLTGTGSADADTLITVGANTLVGAGGNDIFVFLSGAAEGATVADFDGQGAAPGDALIFSGFGTVAQGASFTQVGATNQWVVHSGLDAHIETITLANGASIHASDFLFV